MLKHSTSIFLLTKGISNSGTLITDFIPVSFGDFEIEGMSSELIGVEGLFEIEGFIEEEGLIKIEGLLFVTGRINLFLTEGG